MGNSENAIIQSKIRNNRKFLFDILYIILMNLLLIVFFFLGDSADLLEGGYRDLLMSLLMVSPFLIILSILVFVIRGLQLKKLANSKHMGQQMRRRSLILIGFHSSVIILLLGNFLNILFK